MRFANAPFEDALRELPRLPIEAWTLTALEELCLSIGTFRASTVEAAIQRRALRAWDARPLELRRLISLVDVSAPASCATLRTLDLLNTRGVVRDRLAALHELKLHYLLSDVSSLAGCTTLHDARPLVLRSPKDVSALEACAARALHIIIIIMHSPEPAFGGRCVRR